MSVPPAQVKRGVSWLEFLVEVKPISHLWFAKLQINISKIESTLAGNYVYSPELEIGLLECSLLGTV